jgi:hypothetical protein
MNTTIKDFIMFQNKNFIESLNPDADTINSQPINIIMPMSYSTKTHSPYVGINPYTSTVVSSGFYQDLNKDKSVQKTFTKYYYYKILDKWIYNELMPLLAFVDISKDKPQLIKSMSEYDVNKLLSNTSEQIEKKIDYMEKVLISKDMVRHVLKKICSENNINWYNLDQHEKKIKTIFYDYLLDKLKHTVKKYSNTD